MLRDRPIESFLNAYRCWFSGMHVRIFTTLLGLVLSQIHLWAAESTISKEYQIKAAFIYNFTKFVEWPPSRFPDDSSPIVIGVIGENSFGDELEKIVRDRKVNGRGIAVKMISTVTEATSVHVLFVKAGEEGAVVEMGKQPGTVGVLTVGESDKFLAAGGIIGFTMAADKVRFEISIKAAEKSGLKISAQLQKLAIHADRSL